MKPRGFPGVVPAFRCGGPGVRSDHEERRGVKKLGGGDFRGSVGGRQRERRGPWEHRVEPQLETHRGSVHAAAHGQLE